MRKSLMERSKPLVQKVSSTRGFTKVAPYIVPAMDKVVHRLTKGKVLLSAQMLPGVVLTATGAKSGQPRRTPLACLPEDGGTFILVGSNFGRTDHPAWTGNLIRHPDAEINWKGKDLLVVARLLEGPEREEAWAVALKFWPPYASYAARVDRQIRLFRLVPRAE